MEAVTKSPKHRRRSDPPKRLSRMAKAVWRRTWKEVPDGHFDPEHFTLLATYCETVALHERVTKEVTGLESMLDVDGKIDPRIRLAADLAPKIGTLAGKLRLCVTSHVPSKHGKKKVSSHNSWWESRK